MPFQSISSLKAARKLKNDETTNSAPQNQADDQRASTSAAHAFLGRELEDGFPRTHHAALLAGDPLEIGGVVAEAVDQLGQPLGLLAQVDVLTLERPHLLANLLEADDPLPPIDHEPGQHQQDAGG